MIFESLNIEGKRLKYRLGYHLMVIMGAKGVSRTVIKMKASLYINIPSQLAQLYGISEGDKLEWSQDGPGEFRIRKVSSK